MAGTGTEGGRFTHIPVKSAGHRSESDNAVLEQVDVSRDQCVSQADENSACVKSLLADIKP